MPLHGELPKELARRLQQIDKPGSWEFGLAGAAAVALIGMVASAIVSSGPVSLNIETSATVFLAFLLALILLAWLARDQVRRRNLIHFQSVVDLVQKHLRTIQALTDPLTNVYNRAALEEFAVHCLERAARFQEPLALVVFDLDDFHALNNRYGHSAGDRALVDFSGILRRSTRGSDLVARWGGDEFVLVLVHTPPAGAQVVLGRIHERLAERNHALEGDQVPLSCTAGTAEFREGMNLTEMFQAADMSMLANKKQRPDRRATRTS